jgi:hypothetical protein
VIFPVVLFGPLVEAPKTLESLLQRPSQSNIETDERPLDAVAHPGGRSKISTVNLIDKGKKLIGQRLDLFLREGSVHP